MFFHVITHNAAAAKKLGPLPSYADKETQSYIWRTGHWTASNLLLEPTVTGGPEIMNTGSLIVDLLDVDVMAIARCIIETTRFKNWYLHRKVETSEQVKIVREMDKLRYKYSCIADAIPSHAYFEHEVEIPLRQVPTTQGELYLCRVLTS